MDFTLKLDTINENTERKDDKPATGYRIEIVARSGATPDNPMYFHAANIKQTLEKVSGGEGSSTEKVKSIDEFGPPLMEIGYGGKVFEYKDKFYTQEGDNFIEVGTHTKAPSADVDNIKAANPEMLVAITVSPPDSLIEKAGLGHTEIEFDTDGGHFEFKNEKFTKKTTPPSGGGGDGHE